MNTEETYHLVRQTKMSVGQLHEITVGLFTTRPIGKPELVLSNEDGQLTCARFGSLGHITTLHINASNGTLFMFRDGKKFTELTHEEYMEALEYVTEK